VLGAARRWLIAIGRVVETRLGAQALSPQKRAAQSKVVSMIRPNPSCTVVVPRVSEEIPVTH
jgi:hypothetical protein